MILAIDPGTTESAYVLLEEDTKELVIKGKVANEILLKMIQEIDLDADELVIEVIMYSYASRISKDSCMTILWSGRFIQAFLDVSPKATVEIVTRAQVKKYFQADKDAGVRMALIDYYGGNDQIKKGGALYKVSKDIWAALAVGIYYLEKSTE